MRAVNVGKAQAGDIHAIGIGKTLAEALAAVFGVGVDQRGRVEAGFHGREFGFVFVHRIGGCLDDMLDPGAAGVFQHIDKAQRVDADSLHRVALAVRQGGNARDVIDDIKLFLLKQGFHTLFIADIHLDDIG